MVGAQSSQRPPRTADEVRKRLGKVFPAVRTALEHSNPLELLVATVLSAQCTDERVNRVTVDLFPHYRRAEDYARADPRSLEELIQPTGFFRQKAKSLIGIGSTLMERFGGGVPKRMEDLVTLPGVGRKTANIVLGEAFGINEGIAVDTHVKRVARRLELSLQTDPDRIEEDLLPQVPREEWSRFSHLLIFHGRTTCVARKPKCGECVLSDICPSAFAFD